MNALRWTWARFWALRWRWKAPILVFLFLLVVAAIPTEESSESPDEESTTTIVTTQTSTPSPSPTPESETPSPTPAPASPSPTLTPSATASCPTPDQSAYLLALGEIQGGIAAAFASFSESFIAAGEDTLLIFDADWILEVAVALATMNVAAELIRDLDPAPGTEALHGIQLQIADELETVTTFTARGVDEVDPDLLEEAIAALDRTNALVEESTTIILGFCD